MRKLVGGVVVGIVLLAGVAVPGSAQAHSHFVVLPDGECAWITNGANGGVEGAAHETVHPIHNMVHIGTAGAQMDNPSNPVDVDKDSNAGGLCSGFVND